MAGRPQSPEHRDTIIRVAKAGTRTVVSDVRCDRHVGDPYPSPCLDCDREAAEQTASAAARDQATRRRVAAARAAALAGDRDPGLRLVRRPAWRRR